MLFVRLTWWFNMIDMLSVLYNTVYDDHDKMHMIRYHFTDNVKEMLRRGLLPVWRLCCKVRLAVTAKRFWIWESRFTHLFNLFWRSYMASFMIIGHNLWPVDMLYWIWKLSTWRPNYHVAMGNNLLAIWRVLTVSPVIENKFEIYSCEEWGVKTRLH